MKRAQAAVALVAVALALLCVALIVEAGRRIYHSVGPSKAVAAADGSLYVLSHGKLHVFGADGERRTVVALESLGLPRTPSDLALHRDGRVVLADPDTSTLQRCRLPAGPCQSIDLDLHRVDLQKVVPLNSIKVAIDEDAQRYYVSDNAGHQVVIADFAGRVLDRSKPYTFFYPNHLFVQRPGELSVVDTNHHRIATVDVHGDRFGRELGVVAAGGSGAGRRGRVWPFDAAPLPDGRLVALIAEDGMKDADVMVIDGASRHRIDLGDDSDPFDLEVWNQRIVVADATNYRLQALNLDGSPRADFPPADFLRELAEAQREPAYWKSVRVAAQVGIVLVPLLAILLLWKLGVPLAPAALAPSSANAQPAATRERLTIAYDARFVERQDKLLRRTGWGMAAALLLAVGGCIYLFHGVMLAKSGMFRVGPVIVLLLFAPVVQVLGAREARRRLREFRMESSSEGLRVVGRGRAIVRPLVPWREVYWDGSRLLVGKTMLPTRTPSLGDMFERAEFERAILARVPKANVVSRQRLASQMLRAGGPGTIVAFVLVLALLALYAALKFRLL